MKRCMGCMEQYEEEKNKCPYCGYEEETQPENAMHLLPGTIIEDRYIIGKVIGYGGFGVTYIGYDPILDTKIAVKEYLPSEFSTRVLGQTQVTVFSGDKAEQFSDGMIKFIDEAKRLAKFHSTPGIVKIFDSFESNNTAYIIMELLEGETLSERLKRERTISENEAIEMMKPVMTSLEAVHKEGIIHRDIAPDNIFLTNDGHVKLIDFGAARYATTTHSRSLTVVIKPGYSPEEQYRSRGDQGPHTDVYAVAAVIYRMICGETPPDALERRAYFENKKKDILKPLKDISKNHETAIMNALNVRVEDRTPDMETFLKELESTDKVHKRTGKIKAIDLYKWPLWAKIGVPVIAVCLITFGVLFFTGVIGFDAKLKNEIVIPEGKTRVPSVVNNEFGKAEERLSKAELNMLISGRQYSDTIPYNYIMFQDVKPGSIVPKKTVVGLTISAGTSMRIVPDVTGLEENAAKELLEALGFEVTTEKSDSDSVAKGCVISQSLSPYISAEQGSAVVITVSGGGKAEKSEIPDLVGMKLDDAIKLAEDNGWVIKVTEKIFDKNTERDTVISQTPAAGQSAEIVEVVVSKGWEDILVPDVTYLNSKEAKDLLVALGFEVETEEAYNDIVEKGLVISQTIPAGVTVDPECYIRITISKGVKIFGMPSVFGMSEDEAVTELSSIGLEVKVTYKTDNSKEKNVVIDQSISTGTVVKRGDEVTLTICQHDAVVTVPDLSGKTKDEAKKALKKAGLSVSFNEVFSNSVKNGLVVSQDPKSGNKADDGSTVNVSISKGKDPNATTITTQAPQTYTYYIYDDEPQPSNDNGSGGTNNQSGNSGHSGSQSSNYVAPTKNSGGLTGPVGAGYSDYTFQDIDNDGEKELVEVYWDSYYSRLYRIYENKNDYRERPFTIAFEYLWYDYMLYDPHRKYVVVCELHTDFNGGSLYYLTVGGSPGDFYLAYSPEKYNYDSNEYEYDVYEIKRDPGSSSTIYKVSRSEFIDYIKDFEVLYSYRDSSRSIINDFFD